MGRFYYSHPYRTWLGVRPGHRNKEIKMRYLIVILLFSCNPVKQVLRDKDKFDQVKEAVIRSGACINDTIVTEVIKDSIVYKDSIIERNVPCDDFKTTIGDDTLSVKGGVLSVSGKDKIRVVTKTNTVRDRSLENILKGDIEKLTKANTDKDLTINNLESELKKTSGELRVLKIKYKLHLALLLIGALVIIFRKPLIRIASGIV